MKNYLTYLAAVIFLLAVSTSIFAAPYYDWTGEYDGTEPDTLYLWHFNQSEIYTPTTPSGSSQACNEVLSGVSNGIGMAYIKTESAATFGSGGKFNWGFNNVGGVDPNNTAKIYNSTGFFPMEADPNLSVQFWVRFNDASGVQYFVDKKYADSHYGGYQIWKGSDGRLYFCIGDGVKTIKAITILDQLTWQTNRWYHIAGTWNAADDTARLYRDGVKVASETSAGSMIVDSTYSITLGQRQASVYGCLNGALDELRISRVAYDYAIPLTPHYGWTQEYTGNEPGTMALYHFNTDQISEIPLVGHRAEVIGTNLDWYAYTVDINSTDTSHATFDTGGKFGGGLKNIGGTSAFDRVRIASGTLLFPDGKDPSLSIEFWVKFTDASVGQYFLDNKKSDTVFSGYTIYKKSTGELYFNIGDSIKTIKAQTAVLTWANDVWYHIAGTWNAGDDTLRLYRDGVQVAYAASPGSSIVNHPSNPVNVANRATSTYSALNGFMDELRITSIPYVYSVTPTACGDSGTVYLPGDISGQLGVRDCQVNLYDLQAMVLNWMDCTDPADPVCD